MKKKKTLKIVSKICCIILLFTVIISALVVPSFAYQTTNRRLYDYNWYGSNSYAMAPINSAYYSYPDWEGKLTQYSMNVPNVYTFSSKSNWKGIGWGLTKSVTEYHGAHSRMQFGNWDTFVDGSAWQDHYYYSRIAGDVYPFFDEEHCPYDKFLVLEGTQMDYIAYRAESEYVNQPEIDTGIGLDVIYDPFIVPAPMMDIMSQIQLENVFGNAPQIKVDFDVTLIAGEENGKYQYVNYYGSFMDRHTDEDDGQLNKAGAIYETTRYSFSPIIHIMMDIENEDIFPMWNVENPNHLVRFNSLKISCGGSYDAPIHTASFTMPLLRPVDYDVIDIVLENQGSTYYESGEFVGIAGQGLDLWDKYLFRNARMDDLDIGPLGHSIGTAVEGVMKAEIFPGISLWVLLLIPFTLGLVFTFIKFFAGG